MGGAAAVELLAGSVPALGNVRQYARIVRENAMLRRLLIACTEIRAGPRASAARELVDRPSIILEVAHEDSSKDFKSIESVLDEELDKLQKLARRARPSPARAPGSRTWTRSPAASNPAT